MNLSRKICIEALRPFFVLVIHITALALAALRIVRARLTLKQITYADEIIYGKNLEIWGIWASRFDL